MSCSRNRSLPYTGLQLDPLKGGRYRTTESSACPCNSLVDNGCLLMSGIRRGLGSNSDTRLFRPGSQPSDGMPKGDIERKT